MVKYSISPSNEKFEIPDEKISQNECLKIKEICVKERKKGKEIIVVQGLGFVGSIMSVVVADCEKNNKKPYFVLGVDLPTEKSYWKIPKINSGKSPFNVEDPEVERLFRRTVEVKKNLRATWIKEVYSEADIVVVDINLDVIKPELGNSKVFEVKIDSFKIAIYDIAERIKPNSLLLIETTVPPGTIEKIVNPILIECFEKRGIDIIKNPPLIAHCYERVMPGKEYVNSIKKIWRTLSGINDKASQKAKKFLSNIIDIENFPLSELQNPTASELGKILENSYRTMNIAFIYEWTLLAEDIGVNLFDVVNTIRVRKGTHDNMMFPGFGVGGYCLPKDPLLAEWGSKFLFHREQNLNFSLEAVNVNDLMPHHTFKLLKKGLEGHIENAKITILGASYRKDVGDTRNSPTITLYDDIITEGGIVMIHDPYANKMEGREDIIICKDFKATLKQAEAVVFAVNHKQYENLIVKDLTSQIKRNACIIDASNVLSDNKIVELKKNNFSVFGVGKGHIKYLGGEKE